MGKVYVFLADGFEDVEALGTLDVLRRAELSVQTVSVMGRAEVTSAHGVTVRADRLFDEKELCDAELLVLPGGMPGALNLDKHEGLRRVIVAHALAGKPLAAICAAPLVYGRLGLLKGKRATCYPGFETYLEGASCTAALVEQDGAFITGKGPAATFEFAFALVERLCGAEKVAALRQGMMFE